MVSGRLPNRGYEDDKLIELGKELLAWCEKMDKDEKEIVHLSEWYNYVKEIPFSQWKSIINRPIFLPYYERAKQWMGNRILKNSRLPTAYGSRYLGMYHSDMHDYEEEKADRQELRKARLSAQEALSFAQIQKDYAEGKIKQPD